MLINKICEILYYIFLAIGLFVAFGVVVVGLCHAQEISLYDEKDYGICKVLGGQIVYWQDGDTIRAKSVGTVRNRTSHDRSDYDKNDGYGGYDYYGGTTPDQKIITDVEMAQELEKEGRYYQAGHYYRDGGMEEKAVEMFVLNAEKSLLKNEHDSLELTANSYRWAFMHDEAINFYEQAKQKYLNENKVRDARYVDDKIQHTKKEKKLFESKGRK